MVSAIFKPEVKVSGKEGLLDRGFRSYLQLLLFLSQARECEYLGSNELLSCLLPFCIMGCLSESVVVSCEPQALR